MPICARRRDHVDARSYRSPIPARKATTLPANCNWRSRQTVPEHSARGGEQVTAAGGEQVTATIAGEDLSKSIVDTEARLRSRVVLRDRLLEVLETRRGKVSELVEAERSVAAVNEEIDQARSWLMEMQGRVAFTRINVDYRSGSPVAVGFFEPVRGALGSVGVILGGLLAALIVFGAVALPVGGLAYGVWRLRRRFILGAPRVA